MVHKKEKLVPFPVDPKVVSSEKTLDEYVKEHALDRPEAEFDLEEAKKRIAEKEPEQSIDEIIEELKKEK